MKSPIIRFNVEKFRAINSSDIIINGITVVAGENGCGKSTLSKMIYYLFKTAANYELLVAKRLKSELSNINFFLTICIRELFGNDRGVRNEFGKELDSIINKIETEIPNDEHLNQLLLFIDKIKLSYDLQLLNTAVIPKNNRLKHIANDIVDNIELEKTSPGVNLLNYYEQLNDLLASTFHMVNFCKEQRPILNTTNDPVETARIATFGGFNIEDGEKKLFYSLDFPRETSYIYILNDKALQDPARLMKIKDINTEANKAEPSNASSFVVYRSDLEHNYGYIVQYSTIIQEQVLENLS